jgi:hypothetical protein
MVSRKVIAQFVANGLALAVAWVVARLGLHLSADSAVEVSGAVALVAGAVSGYVAKPVNQAVALGLKTRAQVFAARDAALAEVAKLEAYLAAHAPKVG